ncbi:hypothetical protein ACRAWB_08370 [Leifsonia poae]|uniref:hypothetical protein n=1 Tax=Leifsonia poae TaxID=110933 RepID=UPI003D687A3F
MGRSATSPSVHGAWAGRRRKRRPATITPVGSQLDGVSTPIGAQHTVGGTRANASPPVCGEEPIRGHRALPPSRTPR